ATHRNLRPEPFWRDLIDRWRTSGQSIAAYCAAHRVSQATFYAWRKRLAARARATARPAPAFAPVRVVPDPIAEVTLPTGLVARVPGGAGPPAVARLGAALGGGACWTLGLTGRIWVCLQPQDGRKSFDGLAAVVTTHLGREPQSRELFVFRNRRGDRL